MGEGWQLAHRVYGKSLGAIMLAVASMAVFAIYLRHRGSPDSKLVGASHVATAQDS